MSVNLNDFSISPAVGDVDLAHSTGESIISVRFGYEDTAGDIEAGEGRDAFRSRRERYPLGLRLSRFVRAKALTRFTA